MYPLSPLRSAILTKTDVMSFRICCRTEASAVAIYFSFLLPLSDT